MSLEDYTIREAEKRDWPSIGALMRDDFWHREKLWSLFVEAQRDNYTPEDARIFYEDVPSRTEAMLAKANCLVAEHRETKEIAGVLIHTVHKSPKHHSDIHDDLGLTELLELVPMKSRFFERWCTDIMRPADTGFDFFEHFPEIDSCLDILILGVHTNHTRRGLATELTRKVLDWAREKKVGLAVGCFTSPYSQKAAANLGFKVFNEVDILSFEKDGKPLYPGMESYVIRKMALQL